MQPSKKIVTTKQLPYVFLESGKPQKGMIYLTCSRNDEVLANKGMHEFDSHMSVKIFLFTIFVCACDQRIKTQPEKHTRTQAKYAQLDDCVCLHVSI